MKKVILNAQITGLNGEVIVSQGNRQLADGSIENVPVTFGKLALDSIIRAHTRTDEDALRLYNLAEIINNTNKQPVPQVLELSDDDFAAVKESISREAVIVKTRFLQMVSDNNA